MLIGYARISKADGSQSLDLQRDALREAGVRDDSIYEDQASGQHEDRPGLAASLKATDMASSPRVYGDLRNFRARMEAVVSYLKRCFGLRRCNWRGLEHFRAYVWSAVVTHNLWVIARHKLKLKPA